MAVSWKRYYDCIWSCWQLASAASCLGVSCRRRDLRLLSLYCGNSEANASFEEEEDVVNYAPAYNSEIILLFKVGVTHDGTRLFTCPNHTQHPDIPFPLGKTAFVQPMQKQISIIVQNYKEQEREKKMRRADDMKVTLAKNWRLTLANWWV